MVATSLGGIAVNVLNAALVYEYVYNKSNPHHNLIHSLYIYNYISDNRGRCPLRLILALGDIFWHLLVYDALFS